ncbi:MAG: DUF5615 family PIN-like protein [Halobaculum sp.]
MGVTLALLFDEDTEAKFARLAAKDGHDVSRVVSVAELGVGSDDDAVREYARSTGRRIVTHDEDHVAVDPSRHDGVLYAPEQRLPAFEQFRILSAICEAVTAAEELPPVVYMDRSWL